MSIVALVSGGIDSSLMALLAKTEGIIQHPLFIDYGQLGREKELNACRAIHAAHGLPRASSNESSWVRRDYFFRSHG